MNVRNMDFSSMACYKHTHTHTHGLSRETEESQSKIDVYMSACWCVCVCVCALLHVCERFATYFKVSNRGLVAWNEFQRFFPLSFIIRYYSYVSTYR